MTLSCVMLMVKTNEHTQWYWPTIQAGHREAFTPYEGVFSGVVASTLASASDAPQNDTPQPILRPQEAHQNKHLTISSDCESAKIYLEIQRKNRSFSKVWSLRLNWKLPWKPIKITTSLSSLAGPPRRRLFLCFWYRLGLWKLLIEWKAHASPT